MITLIVIRMTKFLELIGLEAYNYFINCTAVQLMIFPMKKKNKMADRYLNTNSNFFMLIIDNHAMLLVQ